MIRDKEPSSDTFTRKTKRGNVVSCLKEHYLRSDVFCQSALCRTCPRSSHSSLLLSATATHYAVFDAAVALGYTDLLEHDAMSDMVLLQTVAQQVRDRGTGRLYSRVRGLTRPLAKRCVFIANEHSAATYAERDRGETPEHRDARAVVKACAWLRDHLGPNAKAAVVLVSEDASVMAAARDGGYNVVAVSLADYIRRFKSGREQSELMRLYDALHETAQQQQQVTAAASSQRKQPAKGFTRYISEDAAEDGVRQCKLFKGKLHVNSHNTAEAEVLSSGSPEPILVIGKDNMNRAINEDIVVVEILPEAMWQAPSDYVARASEDDGRNGESAAQSVAKLQHTSQRPLQQCGRVVHVAKRNWRPYVATLPEDDSQSHPDAPSFASSGMSAILVVPFDRRVPKIRIKTRRAAELASCRIVVSVDSWDVDSCYPDGHIVKELGAIGSVETEVAAVLVENRISCPPFTAALYDTLPANTPQSPWRIPAEEIAKRRDMRGSRVYSIDPPGCRDIDDALSVDFNADGSFVVGVHIADPSYFATEGSLLDKEARVRSTTVYLPHTRFNMIPSELSENLCSLHEGCDKLAVSVVYTVSPSFEVTSEWFGRTVVRSVHALSYGQAQAVLDGSPSAPAFADKVLLRRELGVLLAMSERIKAARIARGAVELFSEEVTFQLDRSTSNIGPTGIALHEELPVNELVAEFMILANESVARRIHKSFPSVSLLRRHPQPNPASFRSLLKCAGAVGVSIDASSNKALAASLNKISVPGSPHAADILKTLATRAMAEAEYFCTGSCSTTAEFYHYGLASDMYTHFTSPIRRYSDIVVHRLLIKAVAGDPDPGMTTAELQAMADHMNARHHASRRAQKDAMVLFQVMYFSQRDVNADAVVYAVRSNALLVHVPQFSIKGTVFLWDKEGHSFVANPNDATKTIAAADISVDTERQTVSFAVASGDTRTVRAFGHVTVHIGVEQSRSHKPDLKLELVAIPQSNAKGATTAVAVGKKDLVSAIIASSKGDDDAEMTDRSAAATHKRPASLYAFLGHVSEIAPIEYAPVPKKKGKKSTGSNAAENASSAEEPGKDKTVRRWALTQAQAAQLERDKTPSARPSWEDEYEQGDAPMRGGRQVEERFSDDIVRSEKAVRDAAHARAKQRIQSKR